MITEKQTFLPSQILEELYPALRRMATKKVALYQATTSLEPGYLDPDEIVDDVLIDMIGTLDPASSSIDLKKRFLNAIEAMIKADLVLGWMLLQPPPPPSFLPHLTKIINKNLLFCLFCTSSNPRYRRILLQGHSSFT